LRIGQNGKGETPQKSENRCRFFHGRGTWMCRGTDRA
jgi:hypothetical protein